MPFDSEEDSPIYNIFSFGFQNWFSSASIISFVVAPFTFNSGESAFHLLNTSSFISHLLCMPLFFAASSTDVYIFHFLFQKSFWRGQKCNMLPHSTRLQ